MNKQVLAVVVGAIALFTIAIVGAFVFIDHGSGNNSPAGGMMPDGRTMTGLAHMMGDGSIMTGPAMGHEMPNGQTMTGPMHTMDGGSTMMTGPAMSGGQTSTTHGGGMMGSGNGMMGGNG